MDRRLPGVPPGTGWRLAGQFRCSRPDPLHNFDLTRAIQLPFGGIADAALRFANFVCYSEHDLESAPRRGEVRIEILLAQKPAHSGRVPTLSIRSVIL